MTTLHVPPRKLLDPDWYTLTVLGHKFIEKDSTFKAGEKYHQIEWSLSADVPGEAPAQLIAWTTVPRSATPSDETSKILIALGLTTPGEVEEVGINVNLDLSTGRRCRGNVTREMSSKGVMQNRVTDYAPLQRKGAAPAQDSASRADAALEENIPF